MVRLLLLDYFKHGTTADRHLYVDLGLYKKWGKKSFIKCNANTIPLFTKYVLL